ncbi:hypothetical protein [Christiangramia forsetii]|uniref:Phage major tail protein n=2 Tax=Christiangramia forsetii TaxID=411153 RepID=A0M442_CHRFK|nr:hypothetical protein [Christiangramia forsetii]GGG24296.1 hypothetical protein GCM10011532_04410 [Christiangramia forsetii]CAL67387.1 hypothetical protein GFO_2431 [Christiangramia forsetii KT0803]
MSKQHNFLGIVAVYFGDPGDGVMGDTLTEFNDIEVGSTTLEGASANEENIPTESNDTYITVDGTVDPTNMVVRLFGVTPEQRVQLMGGKVGTVDDGEDEGNYMAPAGKPSIYQSFKAVGKTVDGKRGVLKIPYGKISARDQGTLTKNGLPAVEVRITANTPESAAGDEGSPYILGFEDVV